MDARSKVKKPGSASEEPRQSDFAATEEFPLQDRPGFLIRRLHQIHVAIFFEECARFDVTPVQYSVLSALLERGQIDQATLAKEIGIDRTNVADVVRRLALRGLVVRSLGRDDRRIRLTALSRDGLLLVKSMKKAAKRAHERTIEPLPRAQRSAFLKALHKLVDANNDSGRAPLQYAWARES